MFTLKTLKTIVADIAAVVRARSPLSDFNRVSVIRALTEAVALQLADLYVQVAKLREIFSIYTATGTDLDARAQDYGLGLARSPATKAFGYTLFGDTGAVKKVASVLASDITTSSTQAVLSLGQFNTGSSFADLPAAGYVIFERDVTAQRELVHYTSASVDTLELDTNPTKNHAAGTSVTLSLLGVDQAISSGTRVRVPATSSSNELTFETLVSGTLLDGDILSAPVRTSSSSTGALYNVADLSISDFDSKPWATATVTNAAAFSGGADLETDSELRGRITATVQSLSRGTRSALEFYASRVGYQDKRVLFAKAVEHTYSSTVEVATPSSVVGNSSAGSTLAATVTGVCVSGPRTVTMQLGYHISPLTVYALSDGSGWGGSPTVTVSGSGFPAGFPSSGTVIVNPSTSFDYAVKTYTRSSSVITISSSVASNDVLSFLPYLPYLAFFVDGVYAGEAVLGVGSLDLSTVSSELSGLTLAISALSIVHPKYDYSWTFNTGVASTSQAEVFLYVNDGTTATPTPVSQTESELLVADSDAGKQALTLLHWPVVGIPHLYSSGSAGFNSTSTGVSAVTGGYRLYDASYSGLVDALVDQLLVDYTGSMFLIFGSGTGYIDVLSASTVPATGDYSVVDVSSVSVELAAGTDYAFNETTGDIELVAPLAAGDSVVCYPVAGASYSYYDGLIGEVQKTINGDPADFVTYPGVKSAGIKVTVAWPNIVTVPISMSIQAEMGMSEASLYTPVKAAVAGYINGLSIGDDVVVAEIVAAAMSVIGVADVQVASPSANLSVLDNSLARTSTSDITIW